MMAKITTGSSFGGALGYDRDKNQQNQKIATFLDSCGVDMNYKPDGMPDPDIKAVVRCFEIQAALNPKVSKPVVHIALTFKPADGMEILLLIGIDTFTLNGEGLHPLVAAGESVTRGQPVLEAELEKIRAAGLSPLIIMVLCS